MVFYNFSSLMVSYEGRTGFCIYVLAIRGFFSTSIVLNYLPDFYSTSNDFPWLFHIHLIFILLMR